jgi:hypothetical protein
LSKLWPRLHSYQQDGVRFLLARNSGALFWQPGLGKTVTLLTAIAALEVPTLVVAPLRVCKHVWPAEAAQWTPWLKLSSILGTPKQRKDGLVARADVYLVNYENLAWLLKTGHDFTGWAIVFDESTKMKSPKAARFKAIRKQLGRFRHRFIATGTPAPNGYLDLWSQMFLVDEGASLGSNYWQYRSRYFRQVDWQGYQWEIRDPARVQEAMRHRVHTLLATDELDMPDLVQVPVEVDLPGPALSAYHEMRKHGVLDNVMAETAAAVQMKLRQLANGFIYDEAGKATRTHQVKLEALGDLLEGVSRGIVLYEFQEDLRAIREAFPHAVPFNDDAVGAWNRGEIDVLLLQPASAGHGLNLQAGGNTLIWYGPPWDLELHDQAIARLWRQGQAAAHVVVHYLVGAGTLDGRILQVLTAKDRTQQDLLQALKEHRATSS